MEDCLPATLLKVTFLHGCFSRFLKCANGTKSRNALQGNSSKMFEMFEFALHLLFTQQ